MFITQLTFSIHVEYLSKQSILLSDLKLHSHPPQHVYQQVNLFINDKVKTIEFTVDIAYMWTSRLLKHKSSAQTPNSQYLITWATNLIRFNSPSPSSQLTALTTRSNVNIWDTDYWSEQLPDSIEGCCGCWLNLHLSPLGPTLRNKPVCNHRFRNHQGWHHTLTSLNATFAMYKCKYGKLRHQWSLIRITDKGYTLSMLLIRMLGWTISAWQHFVREQSTNCCWMYFMIPP